MSAEKLRKAARVLRERAGSVWEMHADPWQTSPGPAGWTDITSVGPGPEQFDWHSTYVCQLDTSSTAEYVATMHPGVGLALADLLDLRAAYHDAYDCTEYDDGGCPCTDVADQILGNAS